MSTTVEDCHDTLKCQRCNGDGQHLRDRYEYEECEVCNGFGDCPCVFDRHAHVTERGQS